MCLNFTIKAKNIKEARELANKPLIAKKDITVYKILNKNFFNGKYYSPHKHFEYEKGNEYYRYGKKFEIRVSKTNNEKYLVHIYDGLHSYRTLSRAKDATWGNRKVFKMVIPKGAEYYLGENKDIVSDRLIWY